MREEHERREADDLAAAKAAAAKLQEASAGGVPVAIPAAWDETPAPMLDPSPSPHPTTSPAEPPEPEDERREHILEGGGRT